MKPLYLNCVSRYLSPVSVVVVIGILAVSCSGGDGGRSPEIVEVEFPSIDLTSPEYSRMRRLLEKEIGIEGVQRVEELITSHVHSIFPYVKYRTHAAQLAEEERRSRELYDAPDDEWENVRFDLLVDMVLHEANRTRHGDIAKGVGQLHEAWSAGLEDCARSHGVPRVEDMMRPSDGELPALDREAQGGVDRRAVAEYERHAESLGFTRDELLDLRHSCSRYAAELPAVDPEVREDLFRLLHRHYLEAVQTWLAENPETLEPVDPMMALDPSETFDSPDLAVDPGDSSELSGAEVDPAGGSELPEGASSLADGAPADRLGPLRLETEDNGPGLVDLGYRNLPDRYTLPHLRDEVAVRLDSVLVRDGVVRGLVQNMSQGLFARDVTVSVDDRVWVFPLTVQPTEVVPFVIDDYAGPTDPDLIKFKITASFTRLPDPKRSFYISGFPGHWVERWGILKETRYPYYADDRPPAGTTDADWVGFYETEVVLRAPSSHPSIADEAIGQTIDDLRIYLTRMNNDGRVLEVREMMPYIDEYVGAGGGYPLVFTPVDRVPFRGYSGFRVGHLTDETLFAITVGGANDIG